MHERPAASTNRQRADSVVSAATHSGVLARKEATR
jgi:hypothetical protein